MSRLSNIREEGPLQTDCRHSSAKREGPHPTQSGQSPTTLATSTLMYAGTDGHSGIEHTFVLGDKRHHRIQP
jgi:hypothetical protein